MNDDKYTIELPNKYTGDLFKGSLRIGDWMTIDRYGVIPLNGPYCCWPKSEPRQFVITSVK